MKTKQHSISSVRRFAMTSAIPVWLVASVQGATLYWDGTTTGPNADGGAGTWSQDESLTNWDTAAMSGSDVKWTNGSDASFGGVGGVVSIAGTVSSASLAFTSTDYRLTNGQLELTGTPVIATGANDVTIDSVIQGTAPITKTGSGTLTLTAPNRFSGPFTIAAGTVKVRQTGQFVVPFGGSSAPTTISSGATLDINSYTPFGEPFFVSGPGVGGAGAIVNNGFPIDLRLSAVGVTYVTLEGPTTIGGSSDWMVSGGFLAMGGHTLTKVGGSEIIIRSPVNSPGDFDVKEGTLWMEGPSPREGESKTVTVRTGAGFGVVGDPRDHRWNLDFEPGTTWRSSGRAFWTFPASIAGKTTLHTPANETMFQRGIVSGAGSLTKAGSGTWNLIGVHPFTGGTTVEAGTLGLSSSSAIGEGAVRGPVSVKEGGTLKLLWPGTLGSAAAARVNPLSVSGGLVDNVSTGSNGAPVINLTEGRLRSNGGVNSAEASSLFLMAENAVINSLPGTVSSEITGRLHLGPGNTGNTTVFDVADGPAVSDLRVHAAITGEVAGSGITKRGAGDMVLHGDSHFTGITVVEQGTLLLHGDGELEASPVNVRTGARFGTLAAGKSVARLTAASGSALILPAGTHAPLVVDGSLDLIDGTVFICPILAANTAPGTYDLIVANSITGSGTPTLDFGGAFGPSGASGTVVVNGNKLQLVLTGTGGDLLWSNSSATGAVEGTWDLSRVNFNNGTGSGPFRSFDRVRFDDSVAPGMAKNIVLGGNLAPVEVTVENSNGDYTFNPPGGLTGLGSLVKLGSGKLTIAGSNSYSMTGPVTAGGGVLDFAGALIKPETLALRSGGSLKNATVVTGAIDLQAGDSNAILTSAAPWRKSTAGTVILTADSKLSGPGTVMAGRLLLGDPATPGATGWTGSGPLEILQGAEVVVSRLDQQLPLGERTLVMPNDIRGSGSLELTGLADFNGQVWRFWMKGDNRNFSGPVKLTAGRLILDGTTSVGRGPISVFSHGTISASGITLPNPINLGGGNTGAIGGKIDLTDANLSGPITLLGDGGLFIGSSGFDGSRNNFISGPIGNSGGAASLHLSASQGSLTLSGNSTYTGPTFINSSSTIHLNGSLGPTDVTVAVLGRFGGYGSIGEGGSLTFFQRATLLANASGNALVVNGDVNLGPKLYVQFPGTVSPEAGSIPILRYTGALTGGAEQLELVNAASYGRTSFSLTPGLISVNFGSQELIWAGSDGQAWETSGWRISGGGSGERFYSQDRVVFDDSGPGGLVRGFSVQPSAVVVDNSTKNYRLGANIGGSGPLTKRGTGMLQISAANAYSGGTVAHAGRLEVISIRPLGTGPVVIGAAATLAGAATFDNPVTVAGKIDPGMSEFPGVTTLGTGPLGLSGTYSCLLEGQYCDRITVTGNLDLTGATLALSKAFTNGPPSWEIMTYTGSLTGGFAWVTGMPEGYGLKYDLPGKRILIVPMTAIGYDDWVAGYPDLEDTASSEDPDHDGIPNLLEMVLGGNPGSADNGLLPVCTVEADHFVYRYKRSTLSRDTTVQTVQWSGDLENWADIPVPLASAGQVEILPESDSVEQIVVRIPRVTGKVLVRLKVATP